MLWRLSLTVHGIGGSFERFDLAGHVLVTSVFDGQEILAGRLVFLSPEELNMRVLPMM
ncbi:hypothetical protein XF_0922 [Xylella fastidiosa 9a5c]|uniref:Uncharacterized protein n=1 Tax=Xylella fastidiosa (strain 9a5c) TaxID=160492 RepID=Q9PEV6_XYLFA|nr:hypothetical protein XF_0922 [Xylella fastidiosa 9a5c]